MKKVIVSIASPDYIQYFLPMIQSSIDEGKWDGDFCLIVNEDIELNILLIYFLRYYYFNSRIKLNMLKFIKCMVISSCLLSVQSQEPDKPVKK